jgi:ABC-type branched-subunit amino acid transport system ATPase component
VIVNTQQGIFNGGAGIYGVPHPFSGLLGLNTTNYGWFFAGFTIAGAAVVYFFVDRITSSPWGRRLRAMRENAEAVESIGTNPMRESLKVYVIGGAIAAASGAFLVEFIGAWSPSAWSVGETFFIFAAVIVGGLGNNFGAALGAFLVLGVFLEVPQYLPTIGFGETDAALQAAGIGVLILGFLWFRPRGIVPERRRKLAHLVTAPAMAGSPTPAIVGSSAALAPSLPGSWGSEPVIVGSAAAVALPQSSSREPEPVIAASAAAVAPSLNGVRDRPASVSGTTSQAPPSLEVHDLVREFGGVHAVDGLSLTLPPGQITGLIGPNGAGKSTVLKMIAGALEPTSGEIVFDGVDIARWSHDKVARAGIIRTFQHTSEFARLTVLENLLVAAPGQPGDSFGGAMLGRRYARKRQLELLREAYSLLEEFSLESHADTYAGELSGGQRRLVEIMRALMARPRVLLLDEPMAGVNPQLRLTIENHLRRLSDGGLTMLMVEHELGAVERVCDSVLVMAQGRLLASGTMRDLRKNEEVISAYLVG